MRIAKIKFRVVESYEDINFNIKETNLKTDSIYLNLLSHRNFGVYSNNQPFHPFPKSYFTHKDNYKEYLQEIRNKLEELSNG